MGYNPTGFYPDGHFPDGYFPEEAAGGALSATPRWLPMELALRLSWLRRYEGMRAAAIAEAEGAAQWAKFALYRNVKVDVHSVPGYPRPNWPAPGG